MIRGEIFMVDLPRTTTSLQSGSRPCVLISNNKANTYSPMVHIIPLTSRNKNNLPTHVEVDKNCGLLVTSIALCEQSMLIPKEYIKEKVGKCDSNTIKKIEKALSIQFGMAIA